MKARTTIITFLLVCALAIPGSAMGSYGNSSGSASDGEQAGIAHRTPTELGQSTQVPDGLAQRTATELGQSSQFASSPSVAASSSDGFDWGDAALGAGAAVALIALGGVGLQAVRRRTPVSPSVSTG